MDGKPLWIEAMSDDELFALNDKMSKELIAEGYYPGKTETVWWAIYQHVVDECCIRNRAKGW